MLHSDKVALMIVEDDSHIRFLLETAARRTGLFDPIHSTDNGLSAWNALRNAKAADLPALIVTDLNMPQMTGLELVRVVKGDGLTRHIPIAIITSSDAPDYRDHAISAGACSFMRKPFGIEALSRALVMIRESNVDAPAATHPA